MPTHDWTRVDAGLFHSFHQAWVVELCRALNAGGLPPDYFALAEQSVRGPVPDVLTLQLAPAARDDGDEGAPGVAVAAVPPRARLVQRREDAAYARRADRVTVRHRHGRVVAVVEIVSPGNKASRAELRAFVGKAADLLVQGVHLVFVDLFPPTRRDPNGLHAAVWEELTGEAVGGPGDRPLTLASYDAGPPQVAYVETLAAGDPLPDMPLFLRPGYYVAAPLAATYAAAWAAFPDALKGLLDATA